MDYERIDRPHQQKGGGLSPAKLRSMLMGMEKKKREVEEIDSFCSLRSQRSGVDDPGSDFSESCKDVDVVREHVECSTSTTGSSERTIGRKLKEQPSINSRTRSNEELDYESVHDNLSVMSSPFEFQKAERGSQRVPPAPFSKPAPSKWDDAQKWIASPTANRPWTGQSQGTQGARKTSIFNNGGRKQATKVVVEVPEEKLVAFEEPDTKKMNSSLVKGENVAHKLVDWGCDPIAEPATFATPPTTARSISMRDMGTEMTPLASQEPSRTGTPVKMKSPECSATSSRSSTPRRAHTSGSHSEPNQRLDLERKELSEKEMQMKTRKEIMELGMQLGKKNIAAWASTDDEDKTQPTTLTMVASDQFPKSVVETRAEAWEEAERAKFTARFEREEMKIQAWENHQKAKSEAELRKIEVEVERMRAKAQDKLMKKLANARHKAEEKRAAAEEKMNKKATETEQEAEYIRRTGRIPSKFSCWSCCC